MKRERLAPPLTWIKDGGLVVDGEEYRTNVPYTSPLLFYPLWNRLWKFLRQDPLMRFDMPRTGKPREKGDGSAMVVSEIRDSANEVRLRDIDLPDVLREK